ncbi:hypothetical protein CXB51_025083 [Gossypium anomalum]|uniref:Uncharacterized protein n=1 Tax=Gossypium anomalum TaxID=47600 RepID=A0A8J5YIK5_9ROSI|nr:hypothetical protein CXB51_025083 [Gossypium anomalum]
MVGFPANPYESVEKLSDSFILLTTNKGTLLKPKYSSSLPANVPVLLPNIQSSTTQVIMDCMMTVVCITHMIQQLLALLALESMNIPATFVHLPPNKVSTSSPTAKEGYVKGVITYTIMDDLTVTPISTISIIAMLHKFNLEQVEIWKRKWRFHGFCLGLELLKSPLKSKTVLTDLFLIQKARKKRYVFEVTTVMNSVRWLCVAWQKSRAGKEVERALERSRIPHFLKTDNATLLSWFINKSADEPSKSMEPQCLGNLYDSRTYSQQQTKTPCLKPMGFYDYAHPCFQTSNPQHPPSIFTEVATIKVIIVSCMWQNNNPKSLCPACYNVMNPKYDTSETYKQGFILRIPHSLKTDKATLPSFINESENQLIGSRSRAVSTERTILSPFTKEYRRSSRGCQHCLKFQPASRFRLWLAGMHFLKVYIIVRQKVHCDGLGNLYDSRTSSQQQTKTPCLKPMGFYDYAHSCFQTSNPQHPPSIFTEVATIKVIIVSCMWQNSNPKSLCPACYNVMNPKYDTCGTYKQGFILRIPHSLKADKATLPSFINESENQLIESRSRAVSTERTILSPFTKEYRVLAAYSGIRLFLGAYFLFWNFLSSSSSKYSLDSDPLFAANTASFLVSSDNVFICSQVLSAVITLLNK